MVMTEKMTEKRFTTEFDIGEDYPFYMLKDGENILFQSTSKIEVEEVCDLLNALHEENKQLQKDCTALIHHNQEYRKENEQLKDQLKNLRRLANEMYMEGSE